MSYHVLKPPTDEARFAFTGKEIVDAAWDNGLEIDSEGFLNHWVRGLRVFCARDDAGKIIGLAFIVVGERWTEAGVSASVLEHFGLEDDFLTWLKPLLQTLGASKLFYQVGDGTVVEPGIKKHTVIEMML